MLNKVVVGGRIYHHDALERVLESKKSQLVPDWGFKVNNGLLKEANLTGIFLEVLIAIVLEGLVAVELKKSLVAFMQGLIVANLATTTTMIF